MDRQDKAVTIEVPALPRRGRRRSVEADRAILQAARDILLERGYAELTVNAVIARAGVSSATLYRRWSNLQDLVAATLRTLGSEPVAIDTGSLDRDLEAFLAYLAGALTHDYRSGAWGGTVLRVDANLRRAIDEVFVKPRKAMLAEILSNACRRGELVRMPPLDDCWSYVSGPVHHRINIRGEPFTMAFATGTAIMLGAGLRALAEFRDELPALVSTID